VDRYYDPSTAQFLSIDPDVAETGQPYAFTGDDPLNSTDPLGLKRQPRTKPSKVGRAVTGLCLLCGAAGAYIGAGHKDKDMPEQPPDSGVVVVQTPRAPNTPVRKLPPTKMVNVTQSAELGPSQPIPQITSEQMAQINSQDTGLSVTVHVPGMSRTQITFTGIGLLGLVGAAVILAPAGA
jgi:hypothetical protein